MLYGLRWRDLKAGDICTIKRGIILKAAVCCGSVDGLPGENPFPRGEQTLDENVLPHGRARRLAENPVDLRFAEEKPLSDGRKGDL